MNLNSMQKISSAELEVMKILWRNHEPVSFACIRTELQDEKGWKKSTINTLIRRLVDKGVISVQRNTVMYYTPNISDTEYRQMVEQSLLDKLYAGSAKNFVIALCKSGTLTADDINDLKDLFESESEGGDE